MDEALAARMHELLAHRRGQHPSSCPVCRRQHHEDDARAAGFCTPSLEAIPGVGR